ncbi:MAG TPA: FAD-dependent oxidoreductase, partial [Thermoanaerobaculia bacterium]|nr:FAD-dependent oxidoreductase [Thermoanaerobaculia bacterium]
KDSPFYVRPRLDPALARFGLDFFRRCNPRDVARGLAAKAALLNLSRQLLGELIEREGLDCEFAAAGLLMVYQTEAGLAESRAFDSALAEHGIEIQAVAGSELRRLEPALCEGLAGGRFFPIDAHLRPDRLVVELARRVREQGGEIEEGCEVHSIAAAADGLEVATSKGLRRGRYGILALGSWSPRFSQQLGLRIPIQPGKGYTITVARPEAAPRIPLLFEEHKVAVTPWASQIRVGSTMEFAGYDTRLNRVRLEALWRGAQVYLPGLVPQNAREEWYGWRPMTPDDLPLLGPAPKIPGLYLAAGHNMLGVSLSTATGEILAAQILGETPPLDLTPFSPTRF